MKTLLFQNQREITPNNFDSLPTHQQEQFLQAGKMIYGKALSVPNIFKNTYENYAFLWEVGEEASPNKILYDVWVFDSDSACVFRAGTAQEAGVCMTQFYFAPTDEETEELEELSKLLQEAFDKL